MESSRFKSPNDKNRRLMWTMDKKKKQPEKSLVTKINPNAMEKGKERWKVSGEEGKVSP